MATFSEPIGIGGQANRYWRPQDGGQYGLEIVGTDDSPGGRSVSITAIGVHNGISAFHFHRARGTADEPLPVLANDTLMSIGVRAWSGVGFEQSSAAIQAFAAEDSDGKSMIGTYVTIETSQKGSGTRLRRVCVWDDGHLQFPAYTAGVLLTDADGNVSADATLLSRIADLEARLNQPAVWS